MKEFYLVGKGVFETPVISIKIPVLQSWDKA